MLFRAGEIGEMSHMTQSGHLEEPEEAYREDNFNSNRELIERMENLDVSLKNTIDSDETYQRKLQTIIRNIREYSVVRRMLKEARKSKFDYVQ